MKYGARVFLLDDNRILVKQTKYDPVAGDLDRYVIDEHRERHCDRDDDKAIADAVRAALSGAM